MNRENIPKPDNGGKWGVLGGTFDPVHFGHINLAQEIKKIKGLDGVIFIPSINNPCKKPNSYVPFVDRVNMLKLALKNYPGLIISEIESTSKLSGYTFDTISALKSKYNRADFYFIIGSDNLLQLSNWYRAEELIKTVKFLAGTRPGFIFEPPEGLSVDNIEFVETSVVKVSSTYIRKILREEVSPEILDKFIPSTVRKYIMERKLYK